MAHFYLILATVIGLTATVHALDIHVLDHCDDCCSPVKGLPFPVRMGDVEYGAFSVCTNGYIHLLPDASTPIQELNNRNFVPTRVNETTGSPFIAPFWQDISTECQGKGTVGYALIDVNEFSNDILIRSGPIPELLLFVSYESVERSNCPVDHNANSFFMVVLTGRAPQNVRQTGVFMFFQSMAWDTVKTISQFPTVGWGDGQGNGFQFEIVGSSTARFLQNRHLLFDLIDGPSFSAFHSPQNEAKLNGMNEGLSQMFPEWIKAQLQQNKDDNYKKSQLEVISKLLQAMQQQKDEEAENNAAINWDK